MILFSLSRYHFLLSYMACYHMKSPPMIVAKSNGSWIHHRYVRYAVYILTVVVAVELLIRRTQTGDGTTADSRQRAVVKVVCACFVVHCYSLWCRLCVYLCLQNSILSNRIAAVNVFVRQNEKFENKIASQ